LGNAVEKMLAFQFERLVLLHRNGKRLAALPVYRLSYPQRAGTAATCAAKGHRHRTQSWRLIQ
jgi:hypothetical protein